MATPSESTTDRARSAFRCGDLLGRHFYLVMAVAMAVIVFVGFYPRLDQRLVHPRHPVPTILWVHSWVFAAWVVLYLLQTALVRSRSVALHRALGLTAGVVAGTAVPVVGVWVSCVMERIHLAQPERHSASFLLIPISEMLYFAAVFWLGVAWRRVPDVHRRLMLLASLSLMAAAFARFPSWIVPPGHFNIAADVLIGLVLLRDLLVEKRIHRVYQVGFPALIVLQLAVEVLRFTPGWVDFATRLLG